MSIKLGDIDVANEIIELQFQLRRTQILLDILIQRSNRTQYIEAQTYGQAAINSSGLQVHMPIISQTDVDTAEQDALTFVQTKFPNMGIKKK